LGGNSIAEGQVFGRRAGMDATKYVKKIKYSTLSRENIQKEIARINQYVKNTKGIPPQEIEDQLKKVMWNKVGIFRDEKRLKEAKIIVSKLLREAKNMRARTNIRQRNRDLQDCLEVNNMLQTAQVVIEAALLRKESRGAHSRTDFPEMKDEWEKNIMVKKEGEKIVTKAIPVVK